MATHVPPEANEYMQLLDELIRINDKKLWTPEQAEWMAVHGNEYRAKLLVVEDDKQRMRLTRQFVRAFHAKFPNARRT